MNFKLIFLILPFCVINLTFCMNNPKMVSTVGAHSMIFNKIPDSLKGKPIIHLKALIEQEDDFSCGHRTLFHALCLEHALKRSKQYKTSFNNNLLELLKDKKSLSNISNKITRYLNETGADPDQSQGIYDYQMVGICQKKLGVLAQKLIPIYLEGEKIMIFHCPLPSKNPLSFPEEFLSEFYTGTPDNYIPLTDSQELKFLLNQLQKPFDSIHFTCLINNHWILASIILNESNYAYLYIIDSENNKFDEHKNTLINKLLICVEEFNNHR